MVNLFYDFRFSGGGKSIIECRLGGGL